MDSITEMARRIADEQTDSNNRGHYLWEPCFNAALAAIQQTTERAAKLAAWAHMGPPDGGSPSDDEVRLADTIATALRAGEHLKG